MILDILFVVLFILCAVIALILVVYFLVRHRLKFDQADKDFKKIVIYGDVRSSYKMHNHIADMIKKENPDMVLFTGDIASNSHNFLHYLIFSIIENKLWKKCEYYPIRGNHESEIHHYQIFLDLPHNKTYYSFDRMGMHFIVLDVIDESLHTELITWLKQDLEQNKTFKLYVELFPNHPNLIVCDDKNKVLNIYKEKGDFLSDHFLTKNCLYEVKSTRLTLNQCNSLENVCKVLSNKTYKLFSSICKDDTQVSQLVQQIENSKDLFIIDQTIQPFHFFNADAKLIKVEDIYKFFITDQKKIASYLKEEVLRKDLEKFYKQSNKKLKNLEDDLNKANSSLIYKDYGNYILQTMYDFDETPETIIYKSNKISLNSTLSMSENAAIYFKKYKKAKNAIEILKTLIEKTKLDIIYFEKKLLQFDKANFQDLQQMKEELAYLGYIKATKSNKKQKKNNKQKKYSPHILNTQFGDIYYGMNDLQNETLTFSIANKEDIFVHIKDYPGSHIIIRRESFNKNKDKILKIAAQLALYLSNVDQSEIYYTQITKVKKNSNKLGLVNLKDYQTIFERKDQKILEFLIKNLK